MPRKTNPDLVLAIYPTTRGYAFVLFEGPLSPFDWGVKQIKGKNKNADMIDSIHAIIEQYRPEVLVIEEIPLKGARRALRIREFYRALAHLAWVEQLTLCRYPRCSVRECFSGIGAKTKFEIAQAIARQIPAFRHRLPRLRKIWMSEDPRQSLFDAAALGLTHYFAKQESDELGTGDTSSRR